MPTIFIQNKYKTIVSVSTNGKRQVLLFANVPVSVYSKIWEKFFYFKFKFGESSSCIQRPHWSVCGQSELWSKSDVSVIKLECITCSLTHSDKSLYPTRPPIILSPVLYQPSSPQGFG